MTEKRMGRADFLKYAFARTTSAAFKVAEDIIEPLKQAGETVEKAVSTPLIRVNEYNGKPKLITASEPPVYLIGEVGKNLTAVRAICGNDGFLLSHLAQANALYCSACNAKHKIQYEEDRIVIDLPVLPLTVKEGYINLLK